MEEVNICHFVCIGIRSGVCEQSQPKSMLEPAAQNRRVLGDTTLVTIQEFGQALSLACKQVLVSGPRYGKVLDHVHPRLYGWWIAGSFFMSGASRWLHRKSSPRNGLPRILLEFPTARQEKHRLSEPLLALSFWPWLCFLIAQAASEG